MEINQFDNLGTLGSPVQYPASNSSVSHIIPINVTCVNWYEHDVIKILILLWVLLKLPLHLSSLKSHWVVTSKRARAAASWYYYFPGSTADTSVYTPSSFVNPIGSDQEKKLWHRNHHWNENYLSTAWISHVVLLIPVIKFEYSIS